MNPKINQADMDFSYMQLKRLRSPKMDKKKNKPSHHNFHTNDFQKKCLVERFHFDIQAKYINANNNNNNNI